MKIDQFALYRVNKMTAGRKLWHLSYNEVREKNFAVRVEFYRHMMVGEMKPDETANEIWKRIRYKTEVSDVLVLNHEGEISCFYLSDDHPRRISGFISMDTTGGVLSVDTRDYKINGYSGNWRVTDYIIIDGKQFYLLEHQELMKLPSRKSVNIFILRISIRKE